MITTSNHERSEWFEIWAWKPTPGLVSNSLEIFIYNFFYVVNQLLSTKNYLKLTCAWVRKVLTCYVSVIKRFPKHEKRRVNLHSQFAEHESLWLTYSCFYSNICIIQTVNVSNNICSLKITFRSLIISPENLSVIHAEILNHAEKVVWKQFL